MTADTAAPALLGLHLVAATVMIPTLARSLPPGPIDDPLVVIGWVTSGGFASRRSGSP